MAAAELETWLPWIRNTLACRVGEFLVNVPASGDSAGQVAVLYRGRLFMIVDGEAVRLADESGKRFRFESVRGQKSRPHDYISYSTFVGAQSAFVENVDAGADGTLDLRFTEVAGEPKKTEFRIGERWLEQVKRSGRDGVLLDGQFVSVAEARARLEAKAVVVK
jgi:hypothetical protein